jgi:phenylacetate-coenzyme A ligase PaaK-like adenylate-forming protein
MNETVRRFHETPLDELLADNARRDPLAVALDVFRAAAARVPAYRRFLGERGVDPAAVRDGAAFARLPTPTKDDYLRTSALPDLCLDGRIEPCETIAHSSGSTGEPTFFPRSVGHEATVAARFEQVFRDAFAAAERRTLAVVCFPLGTWVGGMYTAACLRHVAQKGYPILVATPGNQKAEIFHVVKQLGALFEQVVLLGYPPFLKDVIDTGIAEGLDWRRHALGLVMAGEVFSESFRALVCERAGIADPERGTASLYGTADAGVLGCETPLSVAARRFLAARPELASEVFGSARLPTLVQYDPVDRYFEADGADLLFTAAGGIPLVRYRIGDHGGIVPFDAMMARLHAAGFEPPPGRKLPFVYVFGRAHHAVSFYGANVFVETVSLALEQPSIREFVTGKLVMSIGEDDDANRQLALDVELARAVAPNDALAATIAAAARAAILKQCGEYGAYVPAERQLPVVTLWTHAHPERFPVGVKHRWVR